MLDPSDNLVTCGGPPIVELKPFVHVADLDHWSRPHISDSPLRWLFATLKGFANPVEPCIPATWQAVTVSGQRVRQSERFEDLHHWFVEQTPFLWVDLFFFRMLLLKEDFSAAPVVSSSL